MSSESGVVGEDEGVAFDCDISIHPNPVKGRLNVSYESFEEKRIIISLYPIQGKMVLRKEIRFYKGRGGFQLNLTQIPSGTYLLEFYDPNTHQNLIKKVIVNKR